MNTQPLILRAGSRSRWKLPFAEAELQSLCGAMLCAAGHGDGCVELALIDDAAMGRLHAASLGLCGPTNILSFPAGTGPVTANRPLLGCLALSTDTLMRESFLYGQDAASHAVFLLAHGMAHLLGHDHGPTMDALCRRLEAAAHAALA